MSSPAESARPTATWRTRAVELLVLGVWLALVVHAWSYVTWFDVSMPSQDDFEITPAFLPQSTLQSISDHFWLQINEHRVYLSQWIHFGAVSIVGDFRGGGWAQVVLLALAALAGMLFARRLRGKTRIEDVCFPMLLLQWGHGENLLLGTQVCVALALLLSVLALCAAAWSAEPPSVGRISGVGFCSVLMPLCGGFGLCPSPAFATWVAWVGLVAWRAGRRSSACVAAGWCLFYAACVALYFHELAWPASALGDRSLAIGLGVVVQVLSMTFGGLAPYFPWVAIPAALVLLVAASICAWEGARAGGSGRERALGIGAALVGVLLLAASIGWSRQGAWPHSGWAPRYSLTPAVLVFAAVFGVLLYGSTLVARVVPIAVCALLVIAMPRQMELGRWTAEQNSNLMRPFLKAAESDLPIKELARIYGTTLYSSADGLHDRLVELAAAGLPPYERARPGSFEGSLTPHARASARPAMERLLGGIPFQCVAAPGCLAVALPTSARTATGRFAVLPLAYLPVRPREELTLGVRYRIVQVREGMAAVELLTGELHPLTKQSDRGLHEFTLALEAGGGILELRVESVSNERPGTDWLGLGPVLAR